MKIEQKLTIAPMHLPSEILPLEIIVSDIGELPDLAERVLNFAGERKKFALSGDLGAGKTTFVQAFCKRLGVYEQTTSPTYSLINEYSFKNPEGEEFIVYHLDLYRLQSVEEAMDIGIGEVLWNNNYVLIEWPEIIEDLLPENTVRIKVTIQPSGSRKFLIL